MIPPALMRRAGGAPLVPKWRFRYWRIMTYQASSGYVGFAEVQFLSAGVPQYGGTATASSSFDASTVPANAFDGNTSTNWASNGGAMPQWIMYDYGAGVQKAIDEVRLTARSFTGQGPLNFRIQCSNDGVDWYDRYSQLTGSAWAALEVRTYLLPEAEVDPYWAYTKLLLQFEGDENTATFIDQALGAVPTVYGGAVITEAAGKYGRGMPCTGGASGSALLFPSRAEYAIGTGDCFLEGWGYNTNGSQDSGMFGLGESGATLQFSTTTGDLRVRRAGYPNNGSIFAQNGLFPADSVRRHVAFGRRSGTAYWFVNGTLIGSGAMADNIAQAAFSVGAWVPSGGSRAGLYGGLDSLRLTVGYCRETASFTPFPRSFPGQG